MKHIVPAFVILGVACSDDVAAVVPDAQPNPGLVDMGTEPVGMGTTDAALPGDALASDLASDLGSDLGVAVDWAVQVPGTYDGTETSATVGTLRATFVVTATEQGFEVIEASLPAGTPPKVRFSEVSPDPSNERRGFVRVPSQIYAEGRTGTTVLTVEGSGTLGDRVEPYDGLIDLDAGLIRLETLITAFGRSEPLIIELVRP